MTLMLSHSLQSFKLEVSENLVYREHPLAVSRIPGDNTVHDTLLGH